MIEIEKATHYSAHSLLALLRHVEWNKNMNGPGWNCCPNCSATSQTGHKDGCSLKWHIEKLEVDVSRCSVLK